MMEKSSVTEVIDWQEVGCLSQDGKAGISSTNTGSAVLQEITDDRLLVPNVPHMCISNGLFPEGSDECWVFVFGDSTLRQEKKVFTLFRRATDVIVTFGQLRKLAAVVTKPPDMNLTECSPQAAHWVAGTFRWLRQQRLAGLWSATTTLGRKCVVADWLLDKIYVLEFDWLCEHTVFIPVSLGRDFLAAYVNYINWARQSALREPMMAAARRAMQLVADNLCLDSSWYHIRISVW